MKTTLIKKESVLRKNKFIEIANLAYKTLKRIEGNREVKNDHVIEMQESIKRNGILRDVIICILNGFKYIVDGQHLAKALFEMGENIPCKIVECKDKSEMVQLMIDLNTTSKGWNLTEYINSWAWLGNKNYIFLKEAFNKHIYVNKTITQETVLMMAYSLNHNRTELTKQTKTGKFTLKNVSLGGKFLKSLIECNEYINGSRPSNQALITLMIKEGEKYNHSQFIKNLKAFPVKVQEVNSTRKEGEILSLLQDIYRGKK